MIITEKIDGIHGFIVIQPPVMTNAGIIRDCSVEAQTWSSDDDFGFVAWVQENRATLILELGIGRHSGEWWGHGVRRGYGLTEGDRRFSLFDVRRFTVFEFTPGLGTVPVLYDGPFFETAIPTAMGKLADHGSYAAERFRDPEGIVVNFEGEQYRALLAPRAARAAGASPSAAPAARGGLAKAPNRPSGRSVPPEAERLKAAAPAAIGGLAQRPRPLVGAATSGRGPRHA